MSGKQPVSDRSTEGMVHYNTHSSAQQSIVAVHTGTIRKLVREIGSTGPAFRIADYGCGPGISTINVARPAIDAYRELDADGAVSVCHFHQPGNDWNVLFELFAWSGGLSLPSGEFTEWP